MTHPAIRLDCRLSLRRGNDLTEPGKPRTLLPPAAAGDGWFAQSVCHNCGATQDTAYCPACGQKAARRLVWRDIGRESWERLRVFEYSAARTLARLLLTPGTVAREYVMGRRSAHLHPLKLLVALVAIVVLMLAANRYFSTYGFQHDGDVDRMAERVIGYANWSFSLGIVAIFAGSALLFRRRGGYNLVEHAVLAVYLQNAILAVIALNLLPTLIWRDPAFVIAHKAAAQYYLYPIKLAIVLNGYRQFFLLRLAADWMRWLAAGAVFVAVGWVSLRLYSVAILWLVTHGY